MTVGASVGSYWRKPYAYVKPQKGNNPGQRLNAYVLTGGHRYRVHTKHGNLYIWPDGYGYWSRRLWHDRHGYYIINRGNEVRVKLRIQAGSYRT